MNDDFLKYIKDEKDISRYKISLLEERTNKEYKYRLISIEKDFIDYPFEKNSFKDLDELKHAMSLFKTDRSQFERNFSKNIVTKTRLVSDRHISSLKKKNEYYEDFYKYLFDIKIKEINLLQNEYIKSKLKNADEIIPAGIDSLSETEGVSLAKKRARIQILLYCLSRFIYHKTKISPASIFISSPLSFNNNKLPFSSMPLYVPSFLFFPILTDILDPIEYENSCHILNNSFIPLLTNIFSTKFK